MTPEETNLEKIPVIVVRKGMKAKVKLIISN